MELNRDILQARSFINNEWIGHSTTNILSVTNKLRDKKILSEARKGNKWCTWKCGRTTDELGYILIHSPSHPFRNHRNYVREHRLVMEKHLGRYLKHSETIHHINGIKNDNRIKNLKLCKTAKDHSFYHKIEGCMAGDCNRKHWGNGFCQFQNRQWKIANNPPCRIKNCKNPRGTAKGLCNKHYLRSRNKKE